jgi:hypothetical protein
MAQSPADSLNCLQGHGQPGPYEAELLLAIAGLGLLGASSPSSAPFSPKNHKGRGSKPLPFHAPGAVPALYFCLCHQFTFTKNQKPTTENRF